MAVGRMLSLSIRRKKWCKVKVEMVGGLLESGCKSGGVSWGQPAEEMPVEKWRQVLDTNLTGAFLFAQAAGRQMMERRRGVILNIASIAGMRGSLPRGIHAAAYTASKGCLL